MLTCLTNSSIIAQIILDIWGWTHSDTTCPQFHALKCRWWILQFGKYFSSVCHKLDQWQEILFLLKTHERLSETGIPKHWYFCCWELNAALLKKKKKKNDRNISCLPAVFPMATEQPVYWVDKGYSTDTFFQLCYVYNYVVNTLVCI